MKEFLLIWDFDGVIADTEKIWLQTRMELLNRDFNLNWDFETTNKHLGGMSDKTKKEALDKLGLETDTSFWKAALDLDIQKATEHGFALTNGIEDIFKLKQFEQCIATGGVASKTKMKIDIVGIEHYFPSERVFTVDLVEYGKPEPDLFLLAAHTMGYEPNKCIVIEDSIAGLTAAIRAKMLPIAFTGSEMYHNPSHLKQIKEIGVTHVFDNMKDIKTFLLNL